MFATGADACVASPQSAPQARAGACPFVPGTRAVTSGFALSFSTEMSARFNGTKEQAQLTSILSGIDFLTWATTLVDVELRRSGDDLYDLSDPVEDMESNEVSSVA